MDDIPRNDGRLPYRPEPPDVLRHRYAEAVAPLIDVESVFLGVAPSPGELRTHVLDCEDGLRLVVSREDEAGQRVQVHCSAAVEEGTALDARIGRLAAASGAEAASDELRRVAEARIGEVSGGKLELLFLGFSPSKGIPHWISHP